MENKSYPPPRGQGGWDTYGIPKAVLGWGKLIGGGKRRGNGCTAQPYRRTPLLPVRSGGAQRELRVRFQASEVNRPLID